MATFKAGGKDWVVALDYLAVKRIREQLDIRIDNTDGTVYTMLRSSLELLGNVLWILCQKQAAEMFKMDELQFAQALAGASLKEAREAVADAIVDFLPDEEDKTYLREAIKAHEAERMAAMGPALERIRDPRDRKSVV